MYLAANPVLIILILLLGFVVPIAIPGGYAWRIGVLFMAVAVLSVSQKLSASKRANSLGRRLIPYSFPVYLLHEYPMTTLMRLLALAHITLPSAIAAFFAAPVFVVLICILVSIAWKHLLPKTFAVFTGGR